MVDGQIGKNPVEIWLDARRGEKRCSHCGSLIESRTKRKTTSGRLVCRNCRSALSRLVKVRMELETLPSSESERERRKLQREFNVRNRAVELRQSEGEKLEMILAGNAALPLELENYFNEIGLCVGRKEEFYGIMASELSQWFSRQQIQLLCCLFWQAFHANHRNYDIISARWNLSSVRDTGDSFPDA